MGSDRIKLNREGGWDAVDNGEGDGYGAVVQASEVVENPAELSDAPVGGEERTRGSGSAGRNYSARGCKMSGSWKDDMPFCAV